MKRVFITLLLAVVWKGQALAQISARDEARFVVKTPDMIINPAVGPIPCPYTTFATMSAVFPDRPMDKPSVSRETFTNLERRYAEGLKNVGWREVSPEQRPAFYLGATLHRMSLIFDREVVIGTIFFHPMSSTHRDAQLLALEEHTMEGPSYAGAESVVEIWIQDDDVAKPVRDVIDKSSLEFGAAAWNRSKDWIARLCNWREGLGRDGIAIEALREKLVREMIKVRERARLRKTLTIEMEK